MKTNKKEYRTMEQFEEIAENCLNGNWSDAAKNCVDYGFFANDLRIKNEENQLFSDLYDIAELAEMAQKLVDQKSSADRKYVNGKKRDLHEADLNHLKNAEKVYIEIARLFPNTKLVECVADNELLSPEQIHNKVWEFVRRIALKDFKA